MLILTRRIGETIQIGADVTVTVLDVKGSQVRLGVAAPKEIAVHRKEVAERIAGERRQALARSARHPVYCTCLDCCYQRKHPQIPMRRA